MAAQKPSYTSSTLPITSSTLVPGNYTTLNSSGVQPSWKWPRDSFWQAVSISMQVSGILEAILIIGANLLLLSVILSSPLLRSRMRNKLVINVVISNLLVGVLGAPFTVDYTFRGKWVHSCYVTVILVVLCAFVQNFINMWGVVALLLHYLARLLRYEGPRWLGRLPLPLQRALPALLITAPWTLAVVVLIPIIFGGLDRDMLTLWGYNACPFVLERWARYLLNVCSFFVPAVVLIVLIVLVVRLRHRREEMVASPSKMETGQSVMSSTTQELEAFQVHVVVAVLTLLMMGPEHTFLVVNRSLWRSMIIVSILVHVLSDLLPFVVAVVWLIMLPDVGDHLKELVSKLPRGLACCRYRSPPLLTGSSSISPVAFKDLEDE